MDFMNRGQRPGQQNTQPADNSGLSHKPAESRTSKLKNSTKLMKYANVAFVGAITVLLVAVLLSFAFSKDVGSREYSNVDKSKLQAVFLNGGQVYFGNISDLNSKYLTLGNIYYLRVNQQVQPNQQSSTNSNDISLVKLGCELHGPQDSMVINREQVIFWENLKGDGQVAKAVDEYVKANPKGQDCSQQNNTSSNNSSTNSTTNNTTTNNSTTSNPAQNTTTNKKP